jgi:hypothetical protein
LIPSFILGEAVLETLNVTGRVSIRTNKGMGIREAYVTE